MTYYLYHIPGKKIGVTRDLKYRVEEQQGYNEGEYEIILQTDDITIASELEIQYQKAFNYRVDETPYNKLKFNNKFKSPLIIIAKTPIKQETKPIILIKLTFSLKKIAEIKIINMGEEV